MGELNETIIIYINIIIFIYINNITIFKQRNNHTFNENLLSKVNAVDNQWINYNGTIESDNSMMKSQFIPYNPTQDYMVNYDAYVSYYNGEDFITTELHRADAKLNNIEEANGIILSFNKENKKGIKLINKE